MSKLDQLENLLVELSEEKPKYLVSTLVEFLADDSYWLEENLSVTSRYLIVQLGEHLNDKEKK